MSGLTREKALDLIETSESKFLDFKKEQYQIKKKNGAKPNVDKKSELLKDILAFTNTKRKRDAFIFIGVTEKNGSREIVGIPEEDSLDDATFQEIINSKTSCNVEFLYHEFQIEKKLVGIIQIFSQQTFPIFSKNNYGNVRANIVYYRLGSSTTEYTPTELIKRYASLNESEIIVKFYDPQSSESFTSFSTKKTYLECILPNAYQAMLFANREGMNQMLFSQNLKYYREYFEYEQQPKASQKISLYLKNNGKFLATNLHIEITIAALNNNIILKDFDYEPIYPERNSLLRGIDIPKESLFSLKKDPHISIEDKHNNTWKISVNYSKLQAQREVHFDLFQIIAKKSLFAVMEVKIFFDEASTPQRTSLTYEVEVCEQTLSVSELVDMADAFDK